MALLKGKKGEAPPAILSPPPSPMTLAPPSIEDTEKIEGLKEELRQKPDDHGSWLRLGNLYSKNGQVPLAVNAFRHYLALKPDDSEVWRKLGNLLKRSGDVEGAAGAFGKATEHDPGGKEKP